MFSIISVFQYSAVADKYLKQMKKERMGTN